MRLLGAKEFLKTVKAGTLCVEFWLDNEKECFDLIKDYKNGINLSEIFKKYGGEFYIFGDNCGSLAFLFSNDEETIEIDGYKYDCLFYYDKNIVGDANPSTTLQLVYESEDEWPESIYPSDYYNESINKVLHKDDIKRIIKYFLKNNTFSDEKREDAWALNYLEQNEKDNAIINYKGEQR